MSKRTGRTMPCTLCGKADAYEVTRRVEIQPLGRPTHYAERVWKCPTKHDGFYDMEQCTANERAELVAKAGAVREIAGAELRAVREIAGATQPELEQLLGLGRNTVARWETGQRPLLGYIATLVRVLALHPTALRELAAIAKVEAPTEAPVVERSVRAPKRPAAHAA